MPGIIFFMKILVTGCFGFIGLNFLDYLYKNHPRIKIVGLDCLTYASNKKYIKKYINYSNFTFYKTNINSRKVKEILFTEKPNKIINFAAESHVDNSISEPSKFIKSNINGVYNLLICSNNYYRNLNLNLKKKFIYLQVSTDEVFGSLDYGSANENSRFNPGSPYSASKASADHLVNAWINTYSFPAIITNTCNNYGPYQNKEKFIPVVISSILNNQKIPVYGDGKNIREWIYVEDHVKILFNILINSNPGEKFNIGSNFRSTNLEIIKKILIAFAKIDSSYKKILFDHNIKFVKDRLGHDTRYALNSKKIISFSKNKKLLNFKEGIEKTILWFINNP